MRKVCEICKPSSRSPRGTAPGRAPALSGGPDVDAGGAKDPYWHEAAAYEFTEAQVTELEDTTRTLHTMCIEAAGHLLDTPRLFRTLGLPDAARPFLRHSLDTERDRSLYGRFDLAWDGESPAKMLEYNADTPAGLGIRESDGPVTDTDARFVPHFMSSPRSTADQVAVWVQESEPR